MSSRITKQLCAGALLAATVAAALTGCRTPKDPIVEVLEGEALRDDKPVVARVGGEYVYAMDLAKRLEQPEAMLQARQYGEAGARRLILQSAVDEQLLAIRAREEGLHRREGFLQANRALFDNWLASLFRDLELSKRYAVGDEALTKFIPSSWVRAKFRFLVVGSEEELAEALRRLGRGEEFAKVVKELSFGPASREGGLTDFIMPGKDYFPKGIEPEIFAMRPGQVSGPFPGPLGLTVCQMVEKVEINDEERKRLLAWPRNEELNRRIDAYEQELRKKQRVALKDFDLLKAPPDQKVLEIGGRTMTYAEFKLYLDQLIKGMPEKKAVRDAAMIKEMAISALVMARQAVEEDFLKRPTVARRLRRYLNELLARQMQDGLRQRAVVTEEDLRGYFQQNKAEFDKPLRIRASRIVAATLEDAADIRRFALKGVPFRQLAEFRSIDPEAATKGGELGWVAASRETAGDPVKQALFALKKGEISKPVPSGGAFLLLLAEEREEAVPAVFEQVREQVRQAALKARADRIVLDALEELRKKNNVEIFEKELEILPIPTIPAGHGAAAPHGS